MSWLTILKCLVLHKRHHFIAKGTRNPTNICSKCGLSFDLKTGEVTAKARSGDSQERDS